MPLEHRLQILLDDERHRRILAVARERGVSVATVVREAIDRGVGNPDGQRRAAGRRLLNAADMPVPDPADLRAEARAAAQPPRMIVLDTTVLVYAKGAEHPLRDPCRRLVAAITDGELHATTSVEVIQEFVHVRARHRGRTDAVALGNDYSDLLSPLLTITGEHLRQGLAIFEHAEQLGAFDAVLAAAALSAGAHALVSADGAFASVPSLHHVIPDEHSVTSLLLV